jgi:hypothetical protein
MKSDKSDLFIVVYSWYEDYSPTIMRSPKPMTYQSFDRICRSLLNDATDLAIKNGKNKFHIGFHEIIEALIKLLEKRGFVILSLHSFGLWGTCIINKKKDFQAKKGFSKLSQEKILKYNSMLEEKCNKRHHK